MLIINADDWGRSKKETDITLSCFNTNRITSVTAMVFMEDSDRAAHIANDTGIDVGLHLNFDIPFTLPNCSNAILKSHNAITKHLSGNKFKQILYNRKLKVHFKDVFSAQYEEFIRLYGKDPSHIDGHHHMHLCMNMLWDRILPKGSKIRRNFSFKLFEKDPLNYLYRKCTDCILLKRHVVTDYFYALPQLIREQKFDNIIELSKTMYVEIMTHPINKNEFNFLMSPSCLYKINTTITGSYSNI